MSQKNEESTMTPEERAAYEKYHSWEHFLELHKSQFENMGLPKYLWRIAYKKLYSNERVVSATDVFSRVQAPIEQGGGYNLTTKVAQKRWNDVWIVPHIVDDTREGIYKKLKADDKLVDRLWAMMDLDRIVVADEEPEKKNEEVKGAPLPAASSASASTSTSSSPQASGEHSPPHRPRPVHPDPVLVEVFMAQLPGSTIEQAEAALIKSGNDLVEALTLGVPNAEIDAMEAGMMKTVGAQLEGQSFTKKGQESAAPATAQESAAAEQPVPAPADGLSEEERRKLVRAKTVYECIFKLQYAGYYMVAKPRDADAGPIQDNEVITKFYVHDETGSAVNFADAEPTARLQNLVALTLENTAYSLLWFERDCKAGAFVTRPFPAGGVARDQK